MQQDANFVRLRKFAQTAPTREMREAMRLVAERLMGRKRPSRPINRTNQSLSPVLVARPVSNHPRSSVAFTSCASWQNASGCRLQDAGGVGHQRQEKCRV